MKEFDDFNEKKAALSQAKQALLQKRLNGALKRVSSIQVIQHRPDVNAMPLSFAQDRLWFLSQFEPDNPGNNRSFALHIKGPLDAPILSQAINDIFFRHDILRSSFSEHDGVPVQTLLPTKTLALPVTDFSDVSLSDQFHRVATFAGDEARKVFNVAEGPLIRVNLLRLNKEAHVLIVVTHHILFDGWSAHVFIREIQSFYDARINNKVPLIKELPIQYADYAYWQRQRFEGKFLDKQLAYWKKKLSDAPPFLMLPTDHKRPAMQTYHGAHRSLTLSSSLLKALINLSRREEATLFMILLTGFNILLYRYTGQGDILVGTPVAGRSLPETELLIGFFVNTLVLRNDVSGNPSFSQLLKRVKKETIDALSNQDVPFEKLVEVLKPTRDFSRPPFFQVMFNFENMPQQQNPDVQNLTIEEFEFETGTAAFDLSLEIVEKADGLKCLLEFNTSLFDPATAERMLGHYEVLLQGIVDHPDQPISNLPMLTQAERQQILVAWNDTRADYQEDGCIHQLFEAQVMKTPHAVAVVCEDRQLTYRELNARADRIAQHLQALGVGPDVPVGLLTERCLEMFVGLLGILKAGGAYVPMDPAYPEERLAFIMSDAAAPVLVTQKHLATKVPDHSAHMFFLDADPTRTAPEPKELLSRTVMPDDLAYIIYTSGSTGQPKGVAIPHRNVVALMDAVAGSYSAEQLSGVLVSSSLCFDISVFEIFAPLCTGGKAVLIQNILGLPTLVCADQVTLINTVPSVFMEMLALGNLPSNAATINLGGEPVPQTLVNRLYEERSVNKVFNLYGPTEDTVYSTMALMQKSNVDRPHIGRPIANKESYILDRHLQPVPVGVQGELCLGGVGIARGYHNRPGLTAEKFIPHPFSNEPGARIYKTGDLARYLPDGNIDCLGRMDNQVKFRGYRIELGEIEAILNQHAMINAAVVLLREDIPGDKRLVAYLVCQEKENLEAADLRRYLKEKLPKYMIPNTFKVLDALPLLPNGKLDRRALPMPDTLERTNEKEYVAPQTPIEETLANIWSTVLNIEKIGIHDNFFQLGGHSLLVIRVASKLRDLFQVNIPIRFFFETPTLAGLAFFITQHQLEKTLSDEGLNIIDELDDISEEDALKLLESEKKRLDAP